MMNDFTKEELIVLQQAFTGACKVFSNDEFDSALEIKIQSMIDNYCEHDDKWACCTCRTFICEQCDTRTKL